MVGACLLKNRQVFARKNTRRIVAIFITNCAFKSRVFYRFNHLYTPCRTRNTTFYKLAVMQMPLDGRRVFAEKLTNSLVLILSRNTRRIVEIFITNCAFKSRMFCWFNFFLSGIETEV